MFRLTISDGRAEPMCFDVADVAERVEYRERAYPLTRVQAAAGASGRRVIRRRYIVVTHPDGERETIRIFDGMAYEVACA